LKHKRVKIQISGIVQGVGFRPFVFRLAREKRLKGYVCNTSQGVEIEVVGGKVEVERFIQEITTGKPPLARIVDFKVFSLPSLSYSDFTIRESISNSDRSVLISADIAVCDDCLRELFDKDDRRYLYPFINCTNCGPRYTIIKDIPYDREKTTMQPFTMCKPCAAEYHNPSDRRFHAQPNACPQCGPHLTLHNGEGLPLPCANPIQECINLLRQGKIVAIKGIGGFHLAVDATNNFAVALLRERKHREEKPFALMSYSLQEIERYAFITPAERIHLVSKERPIVLLKKKGDSEISPAVAPRSRHWGVMLPYTPLHYLITRGNFLALVMTSGNLKEEPIAIDNEEAIGRLKGIADYFLVHNRAIYLRSDDSVLKVVGDRPLMIRRSRGYVPVPLFLKREGKEILACGGELKNTVCLTKGCFAFLSQHIGDLENLQTLDFFEYTINHLKKILEINPKIIAYDLHPEYLSTKFALEQKGMKKVGVQHHHAHIASCMAENQIEEEVIGIALDGAGYGLDGKIWGGEVLLANLKSFRRVGHFCYIPMPGNTLAIKEPWRMALSYLYALYGERLGQLKLAFLERLDLNKKKLVLQMIERGVNSPLTSSCGRLFDGVASLIGIRDYNTYEGQAAIELEMIVDDRIGECYPFLIKTRGNTFEISPLWIVKGVVEDLLAGMPPSFISSKFHNTLINIFKDLCLQGRKRFSVNKVVLSGGVFQNVFLLTGLKRALEEEGFEVYTHSSVPTNDGGISLGQAVIAAAKTS